MTQTTHDDALVRDLATVAAEPRGISDSEQRPRKMFHVVPNGYYVEEHNLDVYEPHPVRKKGHAEFRAPASLVTYIDRQDEEPALYADTERMTVTAVFDDHHNEFAGWRDFTARLTFESTPEWRAWIGIDRRFFSAEELAEFIEQWRHTIGEPPHAELLQLIQTFRATRNVTFRDERVDASGDRSLEYVTETVAGGKGELAVPDSVTIGMAPFEGSELASITARFRYRLDHGHASFGVVLEQPDKVARDAFASELDIPRS